MGVRAIDVSRWQGAIDWHAVRGDGVRAAWIKVAGADGSLYRDSRAGANLAGAEAAGIPFGTYYFCSPRVGDAVDQARHAVTCGHGRGQLLPAADVESNPHRLSQHQIDVWVSQFCAEVQRLTGRESVVYTYSGAGLVGYTTAAPRHCPLWIANYGNNSPGTAPPSFNPGVPPAWRDRGWAAWQFNSTTRVRGISGNTVDQNVITDAFWARMTSASDPQPQEDDMINWRPVHCPEHGDAQWLLTFDGDGRPRRLFLGAGDPQLYWALGHIQTVDPIVWTGADAARFMAIPEANPEPPAPPVDVDEASIVAGVVEYLEANGVNVDLTQLGELTERLAAAGRALAGAPQS